MKPVQVIEVRMWGSRVGAVAPDPRLDCYAFAYDPAWRRKDIEVAPLTMPLSDRRDTFVFPVLPRETYLGLPAMLADALPDDFGNALIDAWMATKGIEKSVHHRSGSAGLHGHAWYGRIRVPADAGIAQGKRNADCDEGTGRRGSAVGSG